MYPADIVTNAEKLAGFTDDIELLIFEGADRSKLPTRAQVRRLGEIALLHGFSYTVHLPVDVDVCSDNETFRRFSNDRIEEIVDLTAPLNPYGFVLHLPGGETEREKWTETACLAAQTVCGKCVDGKLFVENLTYPFGRLKPVFERSDAMLCLDIGHAQKAGDSWKEIYREFGERIGVVHFYLCDPDSGRHFGVQNAPRGFVSDVADAFLSGGYEGIVTMEMFCETDFFESKKIMNREMEIWAKK